MASPPSCAAIMTVPADRPQMAAVAPLRPAAVPLPASRFRWGPKRGDVVDEFVQVLKEQAREALPQVEGTLRVRGLHGPVEVIRDRWGVPHIYAQDLHDLFFAQGFVVASERLFQLDFLLRFANGRLATM